MGRDRAEEVERRGAPEVRIVATEFQDVISIGRKIEQVSEWLKSTPPLCATEQQHLEEGSQERVYWQYGYLAALRDVLRCLTTGSTEVVGRFPS
jgi:hypothetical protein